MEKVLQLFSEERLQQSSCETKAQALHKNLVSLGWSRERKGLVVIPYPAAAAVGAAAVRADAEALLRAPPSPSAWCSSRPAYMPPYESP